VHLGRGVLLLPLEELGLVLGDVQRLPRVGHLKLGLQVGS
jgi:hypothetical protein